MSSLLEEHSVSVNDIDIQNDNARRPMNSRSMSVSSLYNDENDGSGHSRTSLSHSYRSDTTKQQRGRAQKSRWDSDCEKQLETPRRCESPMNLAKMITFMDLPASHDMPLKFPSRSSDDTKLDDSVHGILNDVLAILG